MLIYKEFTFDAAHFLSQVPQGHKCRQLHGHTYHLTVFIEGDILPKLGWVEDYGDIKIKVKEVLSLIDHKFLNDVPGLENPTCELMIIWLWDKLKPVLPNLKRLELKETPTSGAIYEG